MELLVFAVIFWVLPIVVGHKIGVDKNRAGWAWAFFLGWLGVIILACLSVKPPNAEQHQSFRLSSASAAGAVAIGPPPNLPAAGWYADPHSPGTVRYWDGMGWTQNTAPAAAASSPAPSVALR
jgi:hypothetical protein